MSWRTLDDQARIELNNRTAAHQLRRLAYGQETYGDDFTKSDPIAEVRDELVDGLNYLEWAERQRAAAIEMLKKALASDEWHERDFLILQAVDILKGSDQS